jgi:hypothetical protein
LKTATGAPPAALQVRGQGHGLAADAWALGVLLHELLVGVSPFGGAGGEGDEEGLATYEAAHAAEGGGGGLQLPSGAAKLSDGAEGMLRGLLSPAVKERFAVSEASGAHGTGVANAAQARDHSWFEGFDFEVS